MINKNSPLTLLTTVIVALLLCKWNIYMVPKGSHSSAIAPHCEVEGFSVVIGRAAEVTGIPVVFVSALEGVGRIAVMDQVIDTYEKWCLRLPTARLNRWLRKVMSRHSWKDSASQPKIKYFTQVKARPPTFVAFVSGKKQLADSELRFLTRSLKEDFDLGGIPVRVMQRTVAKINAESSGNNKRPEYTGKTAGRSMSDKRGTIKPEESEAV